MSQPINMSVASLKGMPFDQAKAIHARLDDEWARTSAVLDSYPKNATGLTPVAVKVTPEWRRAAKAYQRAFAALKAFNRAYIKTFRRELAAERRMMSARTTAIRPVTRKRGPRA